MQLAIADRGNVIIKVVMRKNKKRCPNFRKFRISEVLLVQHPLRVGCNEFARTPMEALLDGVHVRHE
jgi:hypothetical protein